MKRANGKEIAPGVPTAYDEAYERVDFEFAAPEPSRRGFLQVLGAGIVVAAAAGGAEAREPQPQQRRGQGRGGAPARISARLHLGEDGTITVLSGKVECGQGVRAELTQAAAEELGAAPGAVRVVLADTALTPDDGGTFGSRSTPSTVPAVRQAAAAARELLRATAARKWGVGVEKVEVKEGRATREGSEEAFSYAELAADREAAAALARPAPEGVRVVSVESWEVLGGPLPRPNARDIVTGGHAYPSDIHRPGLLYGKVLRAPSYGATLRSVDLAPARELEGVAVVRDGGFVGVAAPSRARAEEAIEAIAETAEWEAAPHPSSEELFDYLREHAAAVPANPFAEVLERSAKTLKRTYTVAYVQHAPMEPRAAVAEWADDGASVTVWTATQNPFSVRGEVARAFGLEDEKVRIIIPDFGGGFGGKHPGECAVEAARLAKAAGEPVRLVWSREEEFTWAQFRPAAVIDAEAGLDEAGNLSTWHFVNINSGANEIQTPYRAGAHRGEFVRSEPPMRHGSYRALATTANTFGRECFMDELAELAGRDPLDFRLAHLDAGRLRDVLEAAARAFGWEGRRKAIEPGQGTGIGLACGLDKGSFVAACVEVAVDPESGVPKVVRVCQAYECGKILDPANLENQVVGAIIMGLGPALREAMRFEGGKVLNASFNRYLVPRFADVPAIDVHLLDRPDLPSVGAGETPLIAVAPAIANACHQATGRRCRSMPIGPAASEAARALHAPAAVAGEALAGGV